MLKASFWNDPGAAFKHGGPMEKLILKYRKETGAPLLTSAFRAWPQRVLKDDDANLVRHITNRSRALVGAAESAWYVLKDIQKTGAQRIGEMAGLVKQIPGCGDTWASISGVRNRSRTKCVRIHTRTQTRGLTHTHAHVSMRVAPGRSDNESKTSTQTSQTPNLNSMVKKLSPAASH
jgi:hypothetical protein